MGKLEKGTQSYNQDRKTIKMRYPVSILILLSSCISHNAIEDSSDLFPISESHVEIKYAQGLEVNYYKDYTSIVSKSLDGNEYYRDSLVLIHSDKFATEISQVTESFP